MFDRAIAQFDSNAGRVDRNPGRIGLSLQNARELTTIGSRDVITIVSGEMGVDPMCVASDIHVRFLAS
jgi:hypothetical protein